MICQPTSIPGKRQWNDSPNPHHTPSAPVEACTVTTHETQDISMEDPHTIGGGGGKERGNTATNPARNSKSRIPYDIPTPPEASRTVAHRLEIAGATTLQAVLNKLLSTEISVTLGK
jgi:hypothetical protein